MTIEKELSIDFFKSKIKTHKTSLIENLLMLCLCIPVGFIIFGILKDISEGAPVKTVSDYVHTADSFQPQSNAALTAFTTYLQHAETDKQNHFYYDDQKIVTLSHNLFAAKPEPYILTTVLNLISNTPISDITKQKIALDTLKYIQYHKILLNSSLSQELFLNSKISSVTSNEKITFLFKKEVINQYGYLWLIANDIINRKSSDLIKQRQSFSDESNKFKNHEISRFDLFFNFSSL